MTRKQACLANDERIVASVAGATPMLAAVKVHETWLRDQALADAIQFLPLSEALVSASVEIGGAEATVALRRGKAPRP